jgi:hypothetical protein
MKMAEEMHSSLKILNEKIHEFHSDKTRIKESFNNLKKSEKSRHEYSKGVASDRSSSFLGFK